MKNLVENKISLNNFKIVDHGPISLQANHMIRYINNVFKYTMYIKYHLINI